MIDLSEYADKTLTFLEVSGLQPDEVAMVCAAILCALSEKIETAHEMVDFLDCQANLAAAGQEVE